MTFSHARYLPALVLWAGCSSPQPEQAKAPPPPAYFQVDPATAGEVTGSVRYAGPKPARKRFDVDEDPGCAELNRSGLYDESVTVNAKGGLANVFVWVKKGLEGKTFAPPEGAVTIDQKGCRFGPHVIGVRVGQKLYVTNSDPVTHNIHPQAKMNRSWNQSQPQGAPALERKFVRPEVMIRVKCNVHSWMRAYIGAVEHPYFAVTGPDGSFSLPNLPPGQYTIEAWHEKMGSQEQQIMIEPSGKQSVSFTFKGE